jgi:hypothetical protein
MKGISGEKPKTAAEFKVGLHQALALNGIKDKSTRDLVLHQDVLAITLVMHDKAAITADSDQAAAICKYCAEAFDKYALEINLPAELSGKVKDKYWQRVETSTAESRGKAEKAEADPKKPDKEAEEQDGDSESDDDGKGGGLSLLQTLQAVFQGGGARWWWLLRW